MRPAFLFEACRVRRLDAAALLADPALAALDPDLDSVLNLNEPADYEAARAPPGAGGHRARLRRAAAPRAAGARPGARARPRRSGEAAAASGLALDEHVVAALNGDQITRDPRDAARRGRRVVVPGRGRRRLSRDRAARTL